MNQIEELLSELVFKDIFAAENRLEKVSERLNDIFDRCVDLVDTEPRDIKKHVAKISEPQALEALMNKFQWLDMQMDKVFRQLVNRIEHSRLAASDLRVSLASAVCMMNQGIGDLQNALMGRMKRLIEWTDTVQSWPDINDQDAIDALHSQTDLLKKQIYDFRELVNGRLDYIESVMSYRESIGIKGTKIEAYEPDDIRLPLYARIQELDDKVKQEHSVITAKVNQLESKPDSWAFLQGMLMNLSLKDLESRFYKTSLELKSQADHLCAIIDGDVNYQLQLLCS